MKLNQQQSTTWGLFLFGLKPAMIQPVMCNVVFLTGRPLILVQICCVMLHLQSFNCKACWTAIGSLLVCLHVKWLKSYLLLLKCHSCLVLSAILASQQQLSTSRCATPLVQWIVLFVDCWQERDRTFRQKHLWSQEVMVKGHLPVVCRNRFRDKLPLSMVHDDAPLDMHFHQVCMPLCAEDLRHFIDTFVRQKSDRKVKNNRQKYFRKLKSTT